MTALTFGERVLTELDFTRLTKLTTSGIAESLPDLLDEAQVVPGREIPQDRITMYAQFSVQEPTTGRQQVLVLCYPADADPVHGYISVLSPAGLALIGRATGETARWVGPGGVESVAKIEEILFQPEASGDYVT